MPSSVSGPHKSSSVIMSRDSSPPPHTSFSAKVALGQDGTIVLRGRRSSHQGQGLWCVARCVFFKPVAELPGLHAIFEKSCLTLNVQVAGVGAWIGKAVARCLPATMYESDLFEFATGDLLLQQ